MPVFIEYKAIKSLISYEENVLENEKDKCSYPDCIATFR